MFLKNFYVGMSARMAGVNSEINDINNSSKTVTYNADVLNAIKSAVTSAAALSYNSISSGGSAFILGSGSTPPAMDDYKLSGDVISGISSSVVNDVAIDRDNGHFELVATLTVTNGNDGDITIGEIGIVYRYGSSSYMLIERTVLDSPITLPPSGIGQIVYTINFDYPDDITATGEVTA